MTGLFTFLLALITYQAFGQSVRSFEEESFHVCAQAVYAFMLDYAEVKELDEIEEKGKVLTQEFIENLSNGDDIALKQNELEEILNKNGWNENGKKLYQKLLNERAKEIESGQDLLRMLANSKDQARANDKAGENIISYNNWDSLVKRLGGDEQNGLNQSEDKPTSNEEPILGKSETKNEPLNILIWISFILIALTGGVVIGYLLAKERFKNDIEITKEAPRIKKKLRELESEKEKLLRVISQSELEKRESEGRNVVFKIENQKSDDSMIETKASSVSIQEKISVKDDRESQTPEHVQLSNSVYFQYPEGDGSFKKEFASSNRQRDSYFEIVFKENFPEGELKFIADRSSYGKILTIKDTSLLPVSVIENPGQVDRPSSITVIETGVVEIKEDRFIIKEGHKLKIKIS